MNLNKKLKFIHITKCAGTSIEEYGKTCNIEWGKYHKEYGWWHEIFRNKSKELKEQYDWFVVVRNPYNRILSEFYYSLKNNSFNYPKREEVNKLLIENIKNRCKNGNHYTEQYKYIDDSVKIHILKFENLETEFTQLMHKYNIIICRLEVKNMNDKYRFFKIKDFSPELLRIINEVYKKDFEMFGYEMENLF